MVFAHATMFDASGVVVTSAWLTVSNHRIAVERRASRMGSATYNLFTLEITHRYDANTNAPGAKTASYRVSLPSAPSRATVGVILNTPPCLTAVRQLTDRQRNLSVHVLCAPLCHACVPVRREATVRGP